MTTIGQSVGAVGHSAPANPAEVLSEAQQDVRAALAHALDRLDPRTRLVAGYHRGWWDADGRPDPSGTGGKAVRPALALLSALAAGGSEDAALPGAVSAELVHDFSLLHDDVMDRDELRRHRPTAWVVFGTADALLAGDALLSLATEVLLDVGSPEATGTARALSRAVRALIAGQSADLRFERQAQVSVQECLEMAAGKTASLLSYAAGSGARLTGAPHPVVRALESYGHEIGMAFQLVDDLLGIWGDPEVTGKPVLSDLRARKKTVPVTMALASGGPEADALRALLAGEHELADTALATAARLVEESGARARVEQAVRSHHDRAVAALDQVRLDAGARGMLVELSTSLTGRLC